MNPDQAVDIRDYQLDEYEKIIDRIMEDENIDLHEAERRYSRTKEKYLAMYETDDCND